MFTFHSHAAEIKTLQQLLEAVKQDKLQEQQLNEQRIAEFKAKRDQQAVLLEKAKQEFEQLQIQNQTLQKQFEANNSRILQQRDQLQQHSQDLHSLFQQLRQLATDLQPSFKQSLLAVQDNARAEQLQSLADSQDVFNLEQLKQIWHLFLADMVAGSEIKRFQTTLITSDGREAQREVLRVGDFNAMSDGVFLRYLPDTGKLMMPQQQPSTHWQQLALAQQQANIGLVSSVIDPSRGEVLDLLEQTPNWLEQIQQGGVIGYIIIALGAVGLLLALERLLVLWWLRRSMRQQLQHPETPSKNPLGRVLAVYYEKPERDTETLELKLDEAILREMPSLRRGLNSLGVLASIAPLLGLLGTVTGIIHTFQSITVQDAGDPKIMSGGIAEALVTTELGLLVAIPLLLSHSLLRSMSNNLIHILDEQSAALVAQQAEQRNLHLSDTHVEL